MTTSRARDRTGRHPPAALGGGDLDAVLAQRRHGHLDVRHRRQRRRRAARSRPSSKRAAASSRPETICEDSLASTSTAPPRTRPVPCTVNGARPRPPSSIPTPEARAARRSGRRWAARAAAGRRPPGRGRRRARRPAAGTAARCRPARRRPRPGRGAAPGVTSQSAPSSAMPTPSARRPPAIRSVSRARSGAHEPARPVGQRGQDQRPRGDRLGAGQGDDRVDGRGAVRRRPDLGHRRSARRSLTPRKLGEPRDRPSHRPRTGSAGLRLVRLLRREHVRSSRRLANSNMPSSDSSRP